MTPQMPPTFLANEKIDIIKRGSIKDRMADEQLRADQSASALDLWLGDVSQVLEISAACD